MSDMTVEDFMAEWEACVIDTEPVEVEEAPPSVVDGTLLLETTPTSSQTEESVAGLAEMRKYAGPSRKQAAKDKKEKEVAKKNLEQRQALFNRLGGSILYHPKGAVYQRT